MGWKKGEGLGLDGNGAKEHLKIELRDEQRGLGWSEETETKQMSNYSQILKRLGGSAEAVQEKPRKGKAHRRKHIAAKDVSKYDEQSLREIFG